MCYINLNKSSDLQPATGLSNWTIRHSTVDYDLPGVRVYGEGEGAAAADPDYLLVGWLVTARKHLHHS